MRRGFSLVEMMAVVSVIGIVGGVAAFAMSGQIADARAKAEARLVVQRLRTEHRAAREQMAGLKVTAQARTVRFQNTRGANCAIAVGDAREVTFEQAALHIVSPQTGACFNARGEPDAGGGNTGGTIIVGNNTLNGLNNEGSGAGGADAEIAMAVSAGDGDNQLLMPLRVDRSGIVDLTPQRVTEEELVAFLGGLATNPDQLVGAIDAERKLSFAFAEGTALNATGAEQAPPPPPPTGTCVDGTGLAIECPQ